MFYYRLEGLGILVICQVELVILPMGGLQLIL